MWPHLRRRCRATLLNLRLRAPEIAVCAHFNLSNGKTEDCQGHKLAGAIKVAHGSCLAAAQFFPGAALPLYLGMTAVTAAQLSLQQAGLSH